MGSRPSSVEGRVGMKVSTGRKLGTGVGGWRRKAPHGHESCSSSSAAFGRCHPLKHSGGAALAGLKSCTCPRPGTWAHAGDLRSNKKVRLIEDTRSLCAIPLSKECLVLLS